MYKGGRIMSFKKKTVRGYDFYESASAMQKAIRRADAKVAGYFALELFHSGFWKYVWKRLLTISAEDCYGVITKEIWSLYQSFLFVNGGEKVKRPKKGRIFISKAVILLCMCGKSRDADHLQCLYYDLVKLSEEDLKEYYDKNIERIPGYAYDVHTRAGRAMGKNRENFFIEEYEALEPKQTCLFDEDFIKEKAKVVGR